MHLKNSVVDWSIGYVLDYTRDRLLGPGFDSRRRWTFLKCLYKGSIKFYSNWFSIWFNVNYK